MGLLSITGHKIHTTRATEVNAHRLNLAKVPAKALAKTAAKAAEAAKQQIQVDPVTEE